MTEVSAIRIRQPIGEFYLTALPAKLLLNICYTNPLTIKEDNRLTGNQRRKDSSRIKAISKYLQTQDATLPGTIILAVNCTKEGNILSQDVENPKKRWEILEDTNLPENIVKLQIPSTEMIVAVVDGQHRLWGFEDLSDELKEIRLPCSVFFDLPSPQQASIFATINFNQKPVNKSQTYELFGYNLDDEPEDAWSPEKLAVFLTRKLNVDETSPFKGHIKVAAQDDRVLANFAKEQQKIWAVSTATIVEGILSLISKNPKEDRDYLHREPIEYRSRKKILSKGSEPPPFRELYLSGDRDIVIYKALLNFFNATKEIFWDTIDPYSKTLIRKTAGIQALFHVFKILLPAQIKESNLQQTTWKDILGPAGVIDFSNINIFESSGRGRNRIRDAILVKIKRKSLDKIPDKQFKNYLKTI